MRSGKRTTSPEPQRASVVRLAVLSVLRVTETGVRGAVILVAAGEFEPWKVHLGPRLLLVLGDEIRAHKLTSAVTVRLAPPEVLGVLPLDVTRQVENFVTRNANTLLRHWRGEIDTRETLDLLEKV